VQIAFVASFSPIVRDPRASRAFYHDALGLAFEGEQGDYVFTERLGGVKHFGLWPLSEVAQACFGAAEWPSAVPVPQASVEFEVESVDAVAAAANELEASGHRLLHAARTEPWTQTIARLLSPEGLLVGVCYTPWFHAATAAVDE
jgi:catechol 2,3-dioxygenase-like lactoylglutathione lyase family enzyme